LQIDRDHSLLVRYDQGGKARLLTDVCLGVEFEEFDARVIGWKEDRKDSSGSEAVC
jgi:hypothetical protein